MKVSSILIRQTCLAGRHHHHRFSSACVLPFARHRPSYPSHVAVIQIKRPKAARQGIISTMLGRMAQASIPSLTARLGALCVGGVRSTPSLPPTALHQPQNQHVGHLLLCSSSTAPTTMLCRFMGNKSCLKTNKSAVKRFRVRGSGSVKRNKAGMSHNTGYKNNTRKRRLASSGGVNGKSIELRMRRLIGK